MIPKTLLVPTWEGHVKALASMGHRAMAAPKKPLRVFLVNLDEGVQAWREAYPADLLFVYSTDKAIEGASVVSPKENFPFVEQSFDLVVYQDCDDKMLDKLFNEELLKLVRPGGFAVMYKEIESNTDNLVKLLDGLPSKAHVNRISSYPIGDSPNAPMLLIVSGGQA